MQGSSKRRIGAYRSVRNYSEVKAVNEADMVLSCLVRRGRRKVQMRGTTKGGE